MKDNIIITLGDSFTFGSINYNKIGCDDTTWPNLISKHYQKTHDILNNSMPGRDVQTIIDNWIKVIPKLKKNDILIVGIPSLQRWRKPMDYDSWLTKQVGNVKLTNRFRLPEHVWSEGELSPKTSFNELDTYIRFINEHDSYKKNFNEIISSLILLTPSKIYVWSWNDWLKNGDVSENFNKIQNEIGWETSHDEYVKTNGKCGGIDDLHFSSDMHYKFAEYVISKLNTT